MMKELSVLQGPLFTDQGSVGDVFADLAVWAGIKKTIARINRNAVEAV